MYMRLSRLGAEEKSKNVRSDRHPTDSDRAECVNMRAIRQPANIDVSESIYKRPSRRPGNTDGIGTWNNESSGGHS